MPFPYFNQIYPLETHLCIRLTKTAPAKGKLVKRQTTEIAAFQQNARTLFLEVEVCSSSSTPPVA